MRRHEHERAPLGPRQGREPRPDRARRRGRAAGCGLVDLSPRDEFPLLAEQAFFDWASVAPLPVSALVAADAALRRQPAFGQVGELIDATRSGAARLLHADVRNVALLRSTGEALELVASGLDWDDGDEVVLYERDFVGCTAPFTRLEARGVRVRWLPDRGDRFDLEDVRAMLTPKTRAVCVSLVNRSHGMRAPVRELAELCRAHDAWLAVDGAQALGVLDVDGPSLGADVIAGHGYKFLCAGFGLAPAYCSDRAVAELRPPLVGSRNAEPSGDASRFEPSVPSLAAVAALHASLALLDDPGREAHALALADAVAEVLAEAGHAVLGRLRPDERSSLVVAQGPDADALRSQSVACVEVERGVRFATHAFNDDGDVARLAGALRR